MRRIWIISKDKKVTQKVRTDAKLNNCPEIAIGVPPIFAGKVGALPYAYEEPDPPIGKPARDLYKEIDELASKVEALEEVKLSPI